MLDPNSLYGRLSNSRGNDSQDLVDVVKRSVGQLLTTSTDARKPGMLLGKIQSGKTRGFLGIIAHGFDNGFDIAIVLTKGTKALSGQTVARFKKDFAEFIDEDAVALFDIMQMPPRLSVPERNRKLIFIAKKQKQNLERIQKLFTEYPDLRQKRVLLVDDEADTASVRFVKNKDSGLMDQGGIARQMDELRETVPKLAFLQVTATPYALYLQPEEYEPRGNFVFQPKRPAFTELLPIHSAYVGGGDYFGTFDENDPRAYLYVEVSSDEQDTLRSLDGRSVRKDRVFTNTKIVVLRRSLLSFIAAVVIRRMQQTFAGEKKLSKYAMVIHNDVKKEAHKFQGELVDLLLEAFADDAKAGSQQIKPIFDEAFDDLSSSVSADGGTVPDRGAVFAEVCKALTGEEIVVSAVNSDNDMAALLNADAELHLRTPYNIFIGGNILDRGITIPNLISFYYGRNPKKMQADTVLQHSRMYGARDRRDLAVTRFYTSSGVYERLQMIDQLENALREAFEKGAHDRGVAFIRSDDKKILVPCAPNKVALSDVVSLAPGGRLLPVGFEMRAASTIKKHIEKLDKLVPPSCTDADEPALVTIELAHEICNEIMLTMDTSGREWNWEGFSAVMDYFSKLTDKGNHKNKIWVLALTGRSMTRTRAGGRFSNAPDTKQQRDIAEKIAKDIPMLLLLRQEGTKEQGWSGHPFWWPVLIAPQDATPCIYAAGLKDEE